MAGRLEVTPWLTGTLIGLRIKGLKAFLTTILNFSAGTSLS